MPAVHLNFIRNTIIVQNEINCGEWKSKIYRCCKSNKDIMLETQYRLQLWKEKRSLHLRSKTVNDSSTWNVNPFFFAQMLLDPSVSSIFGIYKELCYKCGIAQEDTFLVFLMHAFTQLHNVYNLLSFSKYFNIKNGYYFLHHYNWFLYLNLIIKHAQISDAGLADLPNAHLIPIFETLHRTIWIFE